MSRFHALVESRIPEPEVKYSTPWYAKLIYRPGFWDNSDQKTVIAQRLEIVTTDDAHDNRTIAAYFLNSDKAQVPEDTDIIFFLNGHFGCCPSQQEMGLLEGNNQTGATIARLAMLGYPIITFDDRDQGESGDTDSRAQSSDSVGPIGSILGSLGLIRELSDIRAVEKALLAPNRKGEHKWRSVHAVGLSGGGQRVALYLLSNRLGPLLKSAYIAAPGPAFWMELDNRKCSPGSPWGFNQDTYDFDFLINFEYSDLILTGLAHGVKIAFAMNMREDRLMKNWFWQETVPTLRDMYHVRIWSKLDPTPRPVGLVLQVRGDDPTGTGANPKGLCHEYDFDDYLSFLKSIGMPMNGKQEYNPRNK